MKSVCYKSCCIIFFKHFIENFFRIDKILVCWAWIWFLNYFFFRNAFVKKIFFHCVCFRNVFGWTLPSADNYNGVFIFGVIFKARIKAFFQSWGNFIAQKTATQNNYSIFIFVWGRNSKRKKGKNYEPCRNYKTCNN